MYIIPSIIINSDFLYSLGVIFPLLNMVFSQHFNLVQIVVNLPVNKIYFLQELLLVVFQFTNHFANKTD